MSLRFSFLWLAVVLLVAPGWASRDLIVTVNIRKKCAQIDAQNQGATRRTAIVFGMAHEGSEITALEFKGQTSKLHITHLGTQGQLQETIHLESGRPIWVTRIKTTYDAPLSGRVSQREEESLYLQNGRLIQRDLRAMSPVGRAIGRRGLLVHQTSITSPAQAREWKTKALHWQQRATQYQRELAAKR